MSTPIKKAVIVAAGLGTRFLPASKAIPKEMLPVVDKPIIHRIVEGLVESGITQIVIVTGWHKRTIEDHFDYPFELEYRLKQAGKEELFEAQRTIADAAKFVFVRQPGPLGIGDAILRAAPVIGEEPFLAMLGDDIIDADPPVAKQLMDIYEKVNKSVIAVMKVPDAEVSRYGIIDPEPVSDRLYRVKNFVEKPQLTDAPSNLAQVSAFLLTPDFFAEMKKVKPGKGGELWQVDAIQQMAHNDTVYAYEFKGTRYDCGHKLGLLQANVEFALKDPSINQEFIAYLEDLVAKKPLTS